MKNIGMMWAFSRFKIIPLRMATLTVLTLLVGTFWIVWAFTGQWLPLLSFSAPWSVSVALARSDFSYFKSHLRVETPQEKSSADTRHDPALSRKIRDGIGRAA